MKVFGRAFVAHSSLSAPKSNKILPRLPIEHQTRVSKADVDAVGLASHPRRRVAREQERPTEMRLCEGDLEKPTESKCNSIEKPEH